MKKWDWETSILTICIMFIIGFIAWVVWFIVTEPRLVFDSYDRETNTITLESHNIKSNKLINSKIIIETDNSIIIEKTVDTTVNKGQ